LFSFNEENNRRYFVRMPPEYLQSMCEITLDQPLSGVKELGNPTYSNVERVARRLKCLRRELHCWLPQGQKLDS